jgi:UDP-glucose 4-epimerase
MNIKLIGGNGFIGSHVYDALRNDHDVSIIDIDKSVGKYPYSACDIVKDVDGLADLLQGADIVYMFTAISEASKNHDDPSNSVAVNIVGLHNVLAACVKSGVKRIVFSSTSWVYSECLENSVDEDTALNLNAGTNVYSATKICGEVLVRSYQKSFGLDYTILRYGTIYGEGMNPRTAVNSFLTAARDGKAITINSNGYRNFIHVSDIARGIANVTLYFDETKNQTVNLDGDDAISLLDVIEYIREKIHNLNVIYSSSNAVEFKGKNVSLDKSKALLHFVQTISLRKWIHAQIDEKL